MVEISIVVEGGSTDSNASDNVESLRQSFHQFFSELLQREDISIVVHMGYGYRNAAKMFLASSHQWCLFADLDDIPANKKKWFRKLETENPLKPIIIQTADQQRVYFMIQEMEGWFLKQPSCLLKWANQEGYKLKRAGKIEDNSLIKGKDVELIKKPSQTVATLMRQYFYRQTSDGKNKNAHYGKLKTAPAILNCLDVAALQSVDRELQRFVNDYKTMQ